MNQKLKNTKVHLATDHAGFELKEMVKGHLKKVGYTIKDHGAHEYNEDDDYPDFIHPAAEAVAEAGGEDRGIIFGHSGQGEAMVANRHRGVRAAVYYGGESEIITLSREHNDANVLSMGAGFLSESETLDAVNTWLKTTFSDAPRHRRRIEKIDN